MTGAPGTGKTLLARAIAGEAGVRFFFNSGSDFDEMFVGLGASRIRELFIKAKKSAPCIIFIDEIDAIASSRQNLDPTSRQTLNQLLVEIDGFLPSDDIIVIGATNFQNIVNLAAINAVKLNKDYCESSDFEYAIDRVLLGISRSSYSMTDDELMNTAYHELGHAIMAHFTGFHEVHKITILPRGQSLGHTSYLPKKEHNL